MLRHLVGPRSESAVLQLRQQNRSFGRQNRLSLRQTVRPMPQEQSRFRQLRGLQIPEQVAVGNLRIIRSNLISNQGPYFKRTAPLMGPNRCSSFSSASLNRLNGNAERFDIPTWITLDVAQGESGRLYLPSAVGKSSLLDCDGRASRGPHAGSCAAWVKTLSTLSEERGWPSFAADG